LIKFWIGSSQKVKNIEVSNSRQKFCRFHLAEVLSGILGFLTFLLLELYQAKPFQLLILLNLLIAIQVQAFLKINKENYEEFVCFATYCSADFKEENRKYRITTDVLHYLIRIIVAFKVL